MAKYFTKEGDDFKEVEVDLFTQEHVDKVIKDRAERVARQQFGDYDDLKAKVGDYEEKLKSATEKATELEKQLGGAKLETEKVKIMTEFKLPDDMAEFVTGENADEMRTRAEKLANGVKSGKVPIKKEEKPKGDTASDSKAIAGKLFGKKSDD